MHTVSVPRELLDRYNKSGPRYTSYPPVPFWTGAFGEQDYRQSLRDLAERPDDVVSVYVHLPFCAERCHYCGCNAMVTNRSSVVDSYLDRVEHELALVTSELNARRRVVQLHWGGGTPNFLTIAQMQRLFGLLSSYFELDAEAEVSIEMDPRIGSVEQLQAVRTMGFNRVSFGVQDINPQVQEAIGRIQPFELTRNLVEASRELGFLSVNLDLVYGLPGQSSLRFQQTLAAIIGLRPDRVACFSYAHLPHVNPNQKQVDVTDMPNAYEKFDLLLNAIDSFGEAGYTWIGMDHFAVEHDELAVAMRERRLHRNFMGYTVMPAPHMLSFGCSAIGELAGSYVQNSAKLGKYQRTLDEGKLPVVRGHRLSTDDQLRRAAVSHLLCNLELPYNLTEAAFGVGLEEALGDGLDRLRAFADEGLIVCEPNRVAVTDLGRFFLRNLCMEIDAYLKPEGGIPHFSKTI